MPSGTRMAQILDGQLKVGVDDTTPHFSERNPETGDMVGFEADLAREIALAIFGDVGDIDTKMKFVTVTTEEKFAVVEDKLVDVMISVPTMSCSRWKDVNFSSPYFTALQQLAVPEGSTITSQSDLTGKRVCVTKTATGPSSSGRFLGALNDAGARIHIVPVLARPKCLIKLQDGKVDAIVLPSSILMGLLESDPTVHVLPIGLNGAPSTNTYGVVTHPDYPDLMLFLNSLLEVWRADGTLERLQRDNGLNPQIPSLQYRD